ncbi:hypothetical protein DFS33DRAFT_862943 [Desarmillaria ectypa]|nr:hypothetical protein DFS33DRAFT_862943 [Desarmillaria ectypa]
MTRGLLMDQSSRMQAGEIRYNMPSALCMPVRIYSLVLVLLGPEFPVKVYIVPGTPNMFATIITYSPPSAIFLSFCHQFRADAFLRAPLEEIFEDATATLDSTYPIPSFEHQILTG